jgi:hypothetical protein
MNIKNSLTLIFLSAFAGCALPSIKALPVDAMRVSNSPMSNVDTVPARSNDQYESKLYGRDGSIVGEQRPGTTAVQPSTAKMASGKTDSRGTILELYQMALREKEQLTFELQAMTGALKQSEGREARTGVMVAELKTQLAEMNTRGEKLAGQNMELGERLATAQIRRLQAEKLLLEAKLDGRRVKTIPAPVDDSPGLEAAPVSGSPLDVAGGGEQ